jgi:hypothetical protein
MKRLLPIFLVLVIGLTLVATATPAQSQSGNLWGADYYPNPNWANPAACTQQVNLVNMNWGFGSPCPNVPADNFTARFNTDAFFYMTTYYFTIIADDEFTLVIDNIQVFSTVNGGQSGKQIVVPYFMSWQGTHHIDLYYRELVETASVFLTWSTCSNCGTTPTPPTQQFPSLPPNQPPPLITDYGDFTPCMQNNWPQVQCFVPTWNLDAGSISMENQIESWVKCGPADVKQTYYISPQVPAKTYKCSKTLAGWFPE